MRTISFAILFAATLTAAPGAEHQQARRWIAEAERTANPIRLWILARDIHDALEAALRRAPNDVQVRLDLVRFYTMTPGIAGGSMVEAEAHAEEILRRDPALGHFARGYIAYREKQYGPARNELREAVRTSRDAETKSLARRWLGWLSQETQQWDEAFAMFEELGDHYEVARTASFCSCRLERGKAALRVFRRTHPKDEKAKKLMKGLGVR